jgi:diguanylate cyclase (GGDEF)-like protein
MDNAGRAGRLLNNNVAESVQDYDEAWGPLRATKAVKLANNVFQGILNKPAFLRKTVAAREGGSPLTQSGKKTDDLVRLLVITGIASMLLILTVSGYGFYRIFSGYVTSNAEEDAVGHCDAMIEQYASYFLRNDRGQGTIVAVVRAQLPQIDEKLKGYLKKFNIKKIKIYDSGQKIVYSTEKDIIGMVDSKNLRLKNALAGNVDSELETDKSIHDLAQEQVIDADVVETYVPIRGPEGKPVGSFEIYMDVSKYHTEAIHGVLMALGLLTLVTLGVFGSSYLVVRRGAARLREFQDKLEKSAITDKLTGLSNRGHLIERGEEEFQRVWRSREKESEGVSLGCIMIDIDHFKNINDTKGHLAGDRVLSEVASRFKQCMRPYDIVGRYGGEEFVALLPDAAFEECRKAAERVRHSIRSEHALVDGDPVAVTISLGVSSSLESDTCLNDILKRADHGLYKAKQAGRDQVAWV